MSPQIIELVIFAAIAFFIISKLISVLGTSDDDSRYGEPSGLKDVTGSSKNWAESVKIAGLVKNIAKFDTNILANPKDRGLASAVIEIESKIDKFKPEVFIKNSVKAFSMIIEALSSKNYSHIEELVDKRYIETLLENASKYETLDLSSKIEAKISDVTFFGNNVMIRVIFSHVNLKEEWTFLRNINQDMPIWYLSNIEELS